MEKKQYIKPELMVEAIEAVEMIAASIYVDGEGSGDQQMSIGRDGRRGQWGNLWYSED